MQQHLKLEALRAFVLHIEHGLQAVLRQRHRIYETEVKRPGFLRFGAELSRAEAEVEFYSVVSSFRQSTGFRGGGAKVLPGRIASNRRVSCRHREDVKREDLREAMLRQG